MGTSSHDIITSERSLPCNIMTLGVRISIYEFGGHKHLVHDSTIEYFLFPLSNITTTSVRLLYNKREIQLEEQRISDLI